MFDATTLAAVTIFLATAAPTVSLTSVNVDQFSKQQIRNSIALMCCVGLAFSAMYAALSHFVLVPLANQYMANANQAMELAAGALSLLVFFLLSERMFSELVAKKSTRISIIGSISAFFLATTWFFTIGALTGVLLFLTVLAVFDLFKNVQSQKATASNAVNEVGDKKAERIVFKHKPNVHVLFLESFHSSEVLRDIYDIDDQALRDSLTKAGFDLYDDVYSNYPITLDSLGSLIFPEHLFMPDVLYNHKRQPESSVVSTLKNNGYELNLFANDFLQVRLENLFNVRETDATDLGKNMHRMFAPVLGQSSILRRLFSSGDLFESVTLFEQLHMELEGVVRNETDAPQFNLFHFGAVHTPYQSWEKCDGFENTYRNAFERAEKELQAAVGMLKRVDPQSLIIAVGDHGAHRYRYAEGQMGNDPNAAMRENDFDPALIAKDHFSVFLAIHWPVANYADGATLSHVRLFDHVFAALAEDKSVLDNMMPSVSVVPVKNYGQMVAVVDGAALKKWEPVELHSSISYLFDKAAENPNDIGLQLCLVDRLLKLGKPKQALKLSMELCERFPQSDLVHSSAAEVLIHFDQLAMAEDHARKAIRCNRTSGAGYYCLALIAERQGNLAMFDACIRKTFEYDAEYRTEEAALIRYGGALLRNEKYHEMKLLHADIDGWVRPVLERFIDWQMVYKAYRENGNDHIYTWLDDNINRYHHTRGMQDLLTKKITLSIKDANWELTAEASREMLKYSPTHPGPYIALTQALEQMGKLDEAFFELMSGMEAAKSERLVLELGAFAERNSIREASLVNAVVMARANKRKLKAEIEKDTTFDADWYVQNYGSLLGGMNPVDHFITYGNSLMFNPNNNFDTAYYYSLNVDVFMQGSIALHHYCRVGQYQSFRPNQSCLYNRDIPVNLQWRSVQVQ